MTIELTYSEHRQVDDNGEPDPNQFKYSLSATFDKIFMSTFSFYATESDALDMLERVKTAIERGQVTISIKK